MKRGECKNMPKQDSYKPKTEWQELCLHGGYITLDGITILNRYKCMYTLYKTQILPCPDYAFSVWGNCSLKMENFLWDYKSVL